MAGDAWLEMAENSWLEMRGWRCVDAWLEIRGHRLPQANAYSISFVNLREVAGRLKLGRLKHVSFKLVV